MTRKPVLDLQKLSARLTGLPSIAIGLLLALALLTCGGREPAADLHFHGGDAEIRPGKAGNCPPAAAGPSIGA